MSQDSFATTPPPPYYAVIFSSQRREGENGYEAMAQRMSELAAEQPGYLGIETTRDRDGFGITVSYWRIARVERAYGGPPDEGQRKKDPA